MQRSAIPARRSATREQITTRQPIQRQPVETEDDDSYYPQRMPSSAIRWRDTQGNQVIQQGRQRIVIHDEPPPKKRSLLLPVGSGMIIMVLLFLGASWVSYWWNNHQLNAIYGFPRTYQTDAIVYPGDSVDHPSHYIFLNLNGTVEIIELPHGDSAHAKIYKGLTLVSDNAALIPVTGEFKQVNGKEEMLIHIESQTIVYVNDGTQFKPQ